MPRAVTQDPPRGAVHRLAQLRNRLGRLLNKSTLGVLAVDLAADPAESPDGEIEHVEIGAFLSTGDGPEKHALLGWIDTLVEEHPVGSDRQPQSS